MPISLGAVKSEGGGSVGEGDDKRRGREELTRVSRRTTVSHMFATISHNRKGRIFPGVFRI